MRRSLVIPLLVLASLAGGCGDGRGDIEVESSTVRAAKALPAEGPAVGTFARQWSKRVNGSDLHVAGGKVLARLEDGIQAYDARTGKPSWRYREPGRHLSGYAETNGVVVVNSTNSGSSTDSWHTAGLDASTGEILWENTDKWYLAYDDPMIVGGANQPGNAADGTVVVQPDDDDVRLGIDARTGDERWSVSAEDISGDECDVRRLERVSRADGAVVPVRLDCEAPSGAPDQLGRTDGPELPEEVFAAVDAETGEVRWRQDVETVGTDTVTRDGLTLLDYGDQGPVPEVIDRNGRRVFRGEDRSTCFGGGCTLTISGRYAVLTYKGAEQGEHRSRPDRMAIIDTETGKVRRVTDEKKDALPGPWGHDDAGHFYRVAGLQIGTGWENVLPHVVERLDLATGRTERAPIFRSGVVAGRALLPRQVLAAAGDRILLSEPGPLAADQKHTLEAFAWSRVREPYDLGGVRPEEWPDPCKLLAGVPQDPDEKPSAEGRIEIGAVTIPRTTCYQEMPDGYVKIVVNWVTADPEQADTLFDGTVEPPQRGADEEFGDFAGSKRMYRVGRAIVTVDGYDVGDEIEQRILDNLARATR